MKVGKFGALLTSLVLTLISGSHAAAAPQLSLTSTNCTITKVGNMYNFLATGSYSAANSNDTNYKINGYRAILRNNGLQNVQDTSLVSIVPTYVLNGQTLWSQTFNYRFASSLKDVRFYVFNGGSQKGDSGWTSCQRIGF